MSLDEPPLVGSPNARALHRAHPALTAVIVGPHDKQLSVDSSPTCLASSLSELDVPMTEVRSSASEGAGSELVLLAAEAEHTGTAPLLVGAADLSVGPVALIDVVDGPGAATGAVTVEPFQVPRSRERAALAPVRVSRTGRIESSGSLTHSVSSPTAFTVGLLRVAADDRVRAAALWRAAARELPAGDVGGSHSIDLALLALVRGGVTVASLPLGRYSMRRGGMPVSAAAGSGWQQRLRNSSRGDDGAFSRTFVRPMSRRLTAAGLRRDWRPNHVTVASLLIGLLAAAVVLGNSWWCFALAALLLQLSLVVDCVDGEIARFTRSYSPLGAWLDGVSDRIKEFAVIATVATVGVRQGHDLWGLAVAIVAVLTIRQVEDYSYHARLRASAAPASRLLPFRQPDDGGSNELAKTVQESPTGPERWIRTIKQVLHVPIAERYLIMSIGLLTGSPVVFLVALATAVALALVWTHAGRTVRALRGRDEFDPSRPDPRLTELLDLGPLARGLTGIAQASAAVAWLAVALVGLAFAMVRLEVVSAGTTGALAPVVAVAMAAVVLGPGCGRAARTRLGWQLPGWIVACEGALVLGVTSGLAPWELGAGYAWFAAIAWHHYDAIYRVRETGRGPAPWVQSLTLGAEGRLLLVVLWWALGWDMGVLFGVAAPLLLFGWFAESGYSWRSMVRLHSGSR